MNDDMTLILILIPLALAGMALDREIDISCGQR